MEKIRATEIWTVYYDYVKKTWVMKHLIEGDTRDGFHVNDEGDLFLRPKRPDVRMICMQQAWFRKEEHALKFLREKQDG